MRALTIVSIILIIITVGYALLRSESVILGPAVIIEYPEANERVAQVFSVRGVVDDASYLTLNDRRIYPDRDGVFEEELVLPTGYTIVKVYARNRQKRETIIYLPLYIQPYDYKTEHEDNYYQEDRDDRGDRGGEKQS